MKNVLKLFLVIFVLKYNARVAQLVEAVVLDATQCRFESYHEHQTWRINEKYLVDQ